MKRVRSACILQTLAFSQKPELGYSSEHSLKINREEYERYKDNLVKTKTRFVVVSKSEEPDGTLVVHIKKQYNDNTDVAEYF